MMHFSKPIRLAEIAFVLTAVVMLAAVGCSQSEAPAANAPAGSATQAPPTPSHEAVTRTSRSETQPPSAPEEAPAEPPFSADMSTPEGPADDAAASGGEPDVPEGEPADWTTPADGPGEVLAAGPGNPLRGGAQGPDL
jgi:hypothetical protein